jgi:hypothetical protein
MDEQIPSEQDMAEVRMLNGAVARLEQELEETRARLRDAWTRVPVDPDLLKKPWKSDIAVTCRLCGKPTVWRTAKGHAQHVPECPSVEYVAGRKKVVVSDAVWNLLQGLDGSENDENLDDDA